MSHIAATQNILRKMRWCDTMNPCILPNYSHKKQAKTPNMNKHAPQDSTCEEEFDLMQAEIPYFTQDIVNHFRTMQDREYIRRTVTGEYEPVNFPPNSSFRFWVNKELRNY